MNVPVKSFVKSFIDWQQAIAAHPCGMVVADAQAPDFPAIYVNQAFERQTGYSASEVIGRNLRFLQGDDRDQPEIAQMQQALAAQVGCKVLLRNYRKDGSLFWNELTLTPIFDADGRMIQVMGIQNDVSDRIRLDANRKQTEVALTESEAKFRRLVEDANDVIVAWTPEGILTYISPQLKTLTGLDPLEYLGKAFALLTHPDDLDRCTAISQQAMLTGEKQSGIECRLLCSNGNWRWVTANISPIHDAAGVPMGMQGILRDISDLKQREWERQQAEVQLREQAASLERALQELQQAQTQLIQGEKMSSLGQLVAGVAHEINNPVSFIYSNLSPAQAYISDLLHLIDLYQHHYPQPVSALADAIDAIDLEFLRMDLPKLLSSMRTGAERIREIVLSLRTFSRLDEAEFKAADLHHGIESTLMILQHRLRAVAQRPEIEVVKEFAPLPPVDCYAGQLNQVFMNLIVNAIDALEESFQAGKSDLKIVISTEKREQTVKIRIADTGSGMAPETVGRIFDPFFTTKPVGVGTGMGLAISYQIISDRHRGSLRCQSELGQGTEFTIEIPLTQSA